MTDPPTCLAFDAALPALRRGALADPEAGALAAHAAACAACARALAEDEALDAALDAALGAPVDATAEARLAEAAAALGRPSGARAAVPWRWALLLAGGLAVAVGARPAAPPAVPARDPWRFRVPAGAPSSPDTPLPDERATWKQAARGELP